MSNILTAHSIDNSSNCISQFRLKNIILDVLNLCSIVKGQRNHLADRVHQFDTEPFNKNILQIDQMKSKIKTYLAFLGKINSVDIIKRKLSKRLSKRKRQKRTKSENAIKKSIDKESVATKRFDINVQMQKLILEFDQKKKIDDMRLKIDSASKDVVKRKTEAKKFIILLDRLDDLRSAREKSTLGRGEVLQLSEKQSFLSSIEKLKLLWKKALVKYTDEEISLKNKMEKKNNYMHVMKTSSTTDDNDSVIKKWENIMFGNRNMLKQHVVQLNELLSIRNQWDQYISTEDDASRIPIGWVIPSISCNNIWEKYLHQLV